MNCLAHRIVFVALLMILTASTAAAQSIELRLKDGSRWRGEVSDRVELRYTQQGVEITFEGTIVQAGDLYLMVEGDVAGDVRRRTIFRSDIVAIRTIEKDAPAQQQQRDRNGQPQQDKAGEAAEGPGVFLLPLTGMVGQMIRHQEIEKIAEEADKFGPGQIIVLELTTGGGAVVEMEQIARVILEIKKRHRMVAWVHEAISAGCATAMLCDEIYFSTMGTAGSMTAFAGSTSWQGEELQKWLDTSGRWMESGGRSRYIAHAMIHAPLMLSYDKDPNTGEVTFYNDLSGEFILSRPGENLTFNSSNAVHCGFADGIADTTDDLAKLLDLPRWREVNDAGRRIHSEWINLVERANREVPRLLARRQMGTAGDVMENLGRQISLLNELIAWWDRAPNAMYFIGGVAPKEYWERELAELRKQMADLRRQQRGGR